MQSQKVQDQGPFRAFVGADGALQLGSAASLLDRGEAYGWLSSFCADPGTAALIQLRLVQRQTGQVVVERAVDLPASDRHCETAAWDVSLPAAMAPGPYLVTRNLLLVPPRGAPALRRLPPLPVTVRPGAQP